MTIVQSGLFNSHYVTTTLTGVFRPLTVVLVPVLAALSACGANSDEGTVDVSAAASLGPAFTAIIDEFRAAHPGIEVRLSTAGSATLVTQIRQGAQVDVVALSDTAPMDELVDSGKVERGEVSVFATNQLAILVAKGNPLGVMSLPDLVAKKAVTAVCHEAQPCGRSALRVLERADVALVPASLENSVSGVVQKVEMGEADAGLAYVTDGLARSGTVDTVTIPPTVNVVNSYPIAVTSENGDDADARSFVEFVLDEGQQILLGFGFGAPSP